MSARAQPRSGHLIYGTVSRSHYHVGRANIMIAGEPDTKLASFEIGDLTIHKVWGTDEDTPLPYTAKDGLLDVEVTASADPSIITVDYTFKDQEQLQGWYPKTGVTSLWPRFCGNLFPCHSRPSDGMRMFVNVTGGTGIVIYPGDTYAEGPSYMFGIAAGDFEYTSLGQTQAGTEVGVYYKPAQKAAAIKGTQYLAGHFNFYETTYGAYTFGPEVASVVVDWGPNQYGGMEHHPFWHVEEGAIDTKERTHAHEAAHGWFGNGVRIECWEDFVLSEGLATYLAARAVEAVEGSDAGIEIWAWHEKLLNNAVLNGDTIALPDETCNSIDIYTNPLWSNVPYEKGAFFLRAVENVVGRDALDDALASFYQDNVGFSARMQDLLEHIQIETGFDPNPLANQWLRSLGIPG